MSQYTDSHDPIRVAIEILRSIPRKQFVTAKDIHERLENNGIKRDIRSIQRQLENLCNHYQIFCDDEQRPYRYQWDKNAKGWSLSLLDEQESLFLLLAEKHLKNLLPPKTAKSMQLFFKQAFSNLVNYKEQKPKTNLAQEWLNKVCVISSNQPLIAPTIKDGVFEAVSTCLYNNQYLDIEYKNSLGEKDKARIMPLGLAQQDQSVLLVCRKERQQDEQIIAVHRIYKATATTMHFQRPKDFNLEQYERDGRFCYGKGEKVKLTFLINKDAGAYLLEYKLSHDQEHKTIGDKMEITATLVYSQQLEWFLNSYGKAISNIVTEPIDDPAI